jgi:hypothetical protein
MATAETLQGRKADYRTVRLLIYRHQSRRRSSLLLRRGALRDG